MTEILPSTSKDAVDKAVALLKQGDVVVLPTDTIYGIAASINAESGVRKIYDIKSRGPEKPIIIYLTTISQLQAITWELAEPLITALNGIWPGAMSGVFRQRGDSVPAYVTSGKETIAVRIPDHPLCLELVEKVGHPLAVTSANISGMETEKTARGVAEQLGQRVPLVLDGGASERESPSTLIDFSGEPPRLLREGALSFAELRRFLPDLRQISED